MVRPWRKTLKFLLLAAATAACLALGWAGAGWLAVWYDLHRADQHLARWENEPARGLLARAHARAPESAAVHSRLARVHRRLGRLEEMEHHLRRAQALGVPRKQVQRERWMALAQVGRIHEADPHLASLLADPGDDGAEICAAYVNGYCLALEFDAALALIEAWESDYPDDPEPHRRRGDVWYAQSVWNEAVAAYRKALALDPRRVLPRLRLGLCYLELNDTEQAQRALRECLRRDPGNDEARFGLARCLAAEARADEARQLLQELLDDRPTHFEGRRLLGKLELDQNRADEAIAWLAPLAEDWPDDPSVALPLAQALQAVGRHEAARRHLEAVDRAEESLSRLEELLEEVRDRPADVELRYEIGRILMRSRSRDQGLGWLRSLLQTNPDHRPTHALLADYYAKSGQPDLARQHRQLASAPVRSPP